MRLSAVPTTVMPTDTANDRGSRDDVSNCSYPANMILSSGGKNAPFVVDQTSSGVNDITTTYQNGMITVSANKARMTMMTASKTRSPLENVSISRCPLLRPGLSGSSWSASGRYQMMPLPVVLRASQLQNTISTIPTTPLNRPTAAPVEYWNPWMPWR